MFCPYCGNPNPTGILFCPRCGRQLPESPDSPAPSDPHPAFSDTAQIDNGALPDFDGVETVPPPPIPMAYCRSCGNPIADTADFCPRCGTPNTAALASCKAGKQENPTSISTVTVMVLGISATVAAVIFGSIIGGLAGIILGAIGLSKFKQYTEEGGGKCGKVTTGRLLSIIGIVAGVLALIWGIVSAVFAATVLSRLFDSLSDMLRALSHDPEGFFDSVEDALENSFVGELIRRYG